MYVYVCMYVCMYARMYICMYLCMCMYACMYVRMYVCMYVRMYLLFNWVNFGVLLPVRKSRRTQLSATQDSGVVIGSISSRDLHTQSSVTSNNGRKQLRIK